MSAYIPEWAKPYTSVPKSTKSKLDWEYIVATIFKMRPELLCTVTASDIDNYIVDDLSTIEHKNQIKSKLEKVIDDPSNLVLYISGIIKPLIEKNVEIIIERKFKHCLAIIPFICRMTYLNAPYRINYQILDDINLGSKIYKSLILKNYQNCVMAKIS